MALTGGNLGNYVDDSGNVNIGSYTGNSGGGSYSGGSSDSGSGYNSVDSNYRDNAKNTAPLAEYNPYADGVPQSIIDAENELNQRSIPNQEYAQMVQDTIIKDNLGYLSDPNYKGTYSAIEASQAFDYLTRANEGASYTNWAAPKADDQLFTEIVPQWDAARNIRAKATEQYNAPLPTAEQSIVNSVYNNPQLNATQREILNADKMKHGDWNLLPGLDQFKAIVVPSSNIGDSMENTPWWAKIASNIFPSLMSSGAGAVVGGLVGGPVGAAIGGGVVGGLTFLQGVTGVKIPVINELLEGMDILSVWFEQGQGAIGATLKETWDRSMEDGSTDLWELGKTMGDVLKDFPDLWEVGQLSYEVGADLGFDNIFNAGRNLVAGASDTLLGTNFGQVDTNTVSRANMGLGGLFEVAPDSRGYDALTHTYMPLYRMMRDEAVKQGMSYKDAKDYAVNNLSGLLVNYMGTTGLANDYGASSIFDPLNFLPTIEADVASKIGDKTNNVPLQKAAAAAKEGASPIVDAFSVPLIQPIVEFITGKHETQGLDTIMKVYAKELQQSVPVKDMSNLQRRIAGIDNNGLIKNFEHETNPVKRFLGMTEEAKIYNMSENLISLLGASLFDTDISPEIIPELISEFVGISPITPDGPLGKYADTALLKTMQSTMGDISIKDIQDIQKRVDNYRNLNLNRVAIDTVADKLHIKKGDLFDMLDDPKRSAELKQRILKENITLTDERTKITWSPEEVYNKIDAFSSANVGRSQYNLDMLKVDIMETISRKSQNALLDRYNIKPDSWFNRLGELGKDIQSIVLLNYSPSYFVNNFLNNIITRSAVGVGGFDTDKIKTANQKRGLFYSRGSEAYKKTGETITAKKSKDDLIGKAQKKFSDFTDDKTIRGKILKGFNNIDIENIETRSAFEIGANRYWEATWKPGLNLPDLPKELTALGFTPEMNQTIYKLAMDSNSLSEFKQKLAGDVILPGASSTLGQMLQKNYSDAAQVRMQNLIDSMPFIRDAVDDILATGNPEAIRTGFQELIDKLTSNVDLGLVQQLSTEFNDLVTRITGSGFAEFITSKMAIDDLYGDIWINQSTESEMLFAQRIAANRIPEEQFRPEYEAMIAKRNGDYAMARKFDVNHLAATIVGLGINEDIAKQLIINKLQQYDNMQKYINEEHNLFIKFADRNSADYDYAYYAKSKLEMLERVQNMQLDSYKQYDQLIIQYLRDNLDKSYTDMIDRYEQNCKDIQRFREELNAKEIEWVKARMDEPDIYERHRISEEQNQERYTLKMNISTKMFDANRNLQALEGGFDKPKDNGKVNLSLEQTLWLEMLYREANETVANAGEFLEHFIDKSDPKTIFEPSNFSNTNVNESFVEYGKRTQSPENIEAMRQVYANGDAVPLGAIDVKNERMPDEMMGTDYNPIDTNLINTEPIQKTSENFEENKTNDNQQAKINEIVDEINKLAAQNDIDLEENLKDIEELEQVNKDTLEELYNVLNETDKNDPGYETLKGLIDTLEEVTADDEDTLHHAAYDYDAAPVNNKGQKFDTYEQYAVWAKNNGIELTKNNDFIPEKYQSEKYLSDLQTELTNLLEARTQNLEKLNELKEKQKQVLNKDPFSKDYPEFKKREKSIDRLSLAVKVAEQKIERILSHDEYYRNWANSDNAVKNTTVTTDKKNHITGKTYKEKSTVKEFNYGGLLDNIKNNIRFNPEARPDSRPGATGEYVKPAQTEKSSVSVKEKLDQLNREDKVLSREKAKLERKLERLEKEVNKKNVKYEPTIEKQNKTINQIQKTKADIQHIEELRAKITEQARKVFDEQDKAQSNETVGNQITTQPIEQPVANPISNPIDNTPPWDDVTLPPEINTEPIPQQIDDVPPWDETELPPWNDIDFPPEEDIDSVSLQYNNTPIEVMDEIDNVLKQNKKYANSENPYERFQLSTEAAKSYIDDRLNEIFKKEDINDTDKEILKDRFEKSAMFGAQVSESDYYNEIIQKHPKIEEDIQTLQEHINDIRQYYKEITGIADTLKFNRDNLYNIGLRAGYTAEVADAFVEYISKVADKWNDNHPGKDFFKDAPGMDLDVNFFDRLSERKKVYGVDGRRPAGGYSYLQHAIQMFASSDGETLFHEVGHGFQYTLDEASSRELAKYFGWSYEEYVRLRDSYTTGNFSNADDTAKWKDGAEVFARGFVDYLENGKAPTKGLALVFEKFKNFLKGIYQKFQRLYDKESPNYYTPQTNAFNNGEEFYVHANDVSNGVSLKQIFDMLIAEDPTIKETPIPEAPKNIPVETKQNPVNQSEIIAPQSEPAKPFSPKPTNQKIDNFIESGIKKIIDNNKSDNPKLQKISAQDLKDITNSIKVEVYNKTGNNIDTSDVTGWANVLNKYIDNGSGEKINSDISKFIDQATEFKQQNTTQVNAKREFTPYKANWQKSDAKLSMVRTQPFYYADQLVKAGVVHNGEIIAYITTTMPDTISVGGYTFPVIGVDTFDPNALWLYVKDEPIKVTPGKPNGVDYSVFAENGEHPMRFGTTPTTQPWGTAAWETSLPLREALQLWRDEALAQLQTNLNNGSFFGKLNPDQQKALYNWVDGKLRSAYNYQRFASQRYGNTMVDLSMLNYNDRHGFDSALTTMMPYQYWLTRSVMNWGARMIDQPKWFSMYARLEKLIEKNKRDFLPSRLEGMVGIPMPFLPEGLGQGLYFDPFNILLPHKQFYDMTEYFDRNLHTIHKNAISVIEEHYRERRPYDGHIITKKEYDDAMLGKGELYNKVFWDQRNSDETNTGLSGLVGSLINPNVLVSSIWKAIVAKNGNGRDISYSPMYKLGNTLRASARDTAAEGVFNIIADALQLPDKTWRSMLGVESDPIGSAWTNYWTVKYLTDMLYTKEHSYNEVTNAIAEGESNPLWQEARNRYSTSEAYKQQGGALLNDIMQSVAGNKQTSLGNLAGSALVSLFGGRTYTSGEEDFRRMQDLYNQIKNDDGMRTAFSEEFPEYKVGFYANIDDREELLHKILVDNCWNAYNALPQTQKNAVYQGLGRQFQELFVNKESRATDRIDDRTLIEWTRAMHGNVPNISDAMLYQPMQNAFNIQWYNDSLQGLLDRYNRDKQQRYPGIDTIEQGYFNTPLQDQYLAIHPELREYWKWKESIGMANPPLGTYFKQQTAQNQVKSGKYSSITEAVKGQVNNYTKACLKNHIEKGWTMPAAAINQLKIAYTNLGVNIPFETWLKEIKF